MKSTISMVLALSGFSAHAATPFCNNHLNDDLNSKVAQMCSNLKSEGPEDPVSPLRALVNQRLRDAIEHERQTKGLKAWLQNLLKTDAQGNPIGDPYSGKDYDEAKIAKEADAITRSLGECNVTEDDWNKAKAGKTPKTDIELIFGETSKVYHKQTRDEAQQFVQQMIASGTARSCTIGGADCSQAKDDQLFQYWQKQNLVTQDVPPVTLSEAFKPNSAEFNDKSNHLPQEIQQQLEGLKNGSLKKITINTCSSVDRNCAGAADTLACKYIHILRGASDADILSAIASGSSKFKNGSEEISLNDPKEVQQLKDLLTNERFGYQSNIKLIYRSPDGNVPPPSQGDAEGRQLREWLFLSSFRGKAMSDAILNQFPTLDPKKIEINPTGGNDGFGFSNKDILPGTCGGVLHPDQFFGKECVSSESAGAVVAGLPVAGGQPACLKTPSAKDKICSKLKSKYQGNADYFAKLREFKAKNPNPGVTDYSMHRYVQMVPEMEQSLEQKQKPIQAAIQNQPHTDCAIECYVFDADCFSPKGRKKKERQDRWTSFRESVTSIFESIKPTRSYGPRGNSKVGCPATQGMGGFH